MKIELDIQKSSAGLEDCYDIYLDNMAIVSGYHIPLSLYESVVTNSKGKDMVKSILKLKKEGFSASDIVELKEGGLL